MKTKADLSSLEKQSKGILKKIKIVINIYTNIGYENYRKAKLSTCGGLIC